MPNDNFNWRPNDNSATTNLRYTLEAEKWVNAVSSAQRKAHPRSLSGDLGFISIVLHGAFALALLVLLIFLQGIKGVVKWVESLQERRKKRQELQDGLAPNERVWIISGSEKRKNPLKGMFYNEYGELWFIWRFLIRGIFIFACILTVIGLISAFYKPEFDMTDKGFLWFAGAVSVYFAFVEAD